MNGAYAYSPDVWPAIVTLALTIFLGLYSWRRRHITGARAYAFACALSTLWVLGVILEILAVDLAVQVHWRRFQAVWMPPVGVGMSCFILQYAGLGRWLTLRTCALLFLVPLLNAVAIATNGSHHLVWAGFVMDRQLTPLPGPLFWLFNGYILVLGVLNLGVLGWLAFRSPRHRWPVAIILFGQVVGRVGFVLGRFGTDWIGPGELVLFTVGLTGSAYAIAFLGFHFIDPVTAARTAVLRQMGEGMFVLDLEGRF
ncbi:MAG TPA: histidine kinase N-terminal 7TM domain-containing protein, partial [Myxococcota bacterium]|nr:histidine kinase N-terminal 7TM domain-containing protein [Myxococcota bacterium]